MKTEDQTQTAEEVINSSQMEENDEMFTFDHLSGIRQPDMEQVVRNIQSELDLDTLAKALKLGDPVVADKIRSAMSIQIKKEIDEIADTLPKMKVKDIEDEQRKILKLVKEMIYSGKIEMAGELV